MKLSLTYQTALARHPQETERIVQKLRGPASRDKDLPGDQMRWEYEYYLKMPEKTTYVILVGCAYHGCVCQKIKEIPQEITDLVDIIKKNMGIKIIYIRCDGRCEFYVYEKCDYVCEHDENWSCSYTGQGERPEQCPANRKEDEEEINRG